MGGGGSTDRELRPNDISDYELLGIFLHHPLQLIPASSLALQLNQKPGVVGVVLDPSIGSVHEIGSQQLHSNPAVLFAGSQFSQKVQGCVQEEGDVISLQAAVEPPGNEQRQSVFHMLFLEGQHLKGLKEKEKTGFVLFRVKSSLLE